MPAKPVVINDIYEDLWRTFKAGAMLKGMTVAEGVEEALIQYFKVQNAELATSASIASTATDSDSY